MNNIKLAAIAATLLASPFLSIANDELVQDKHQAQSIINAPININSASLEQLVLLKGIGKKKAQAIISNREENGQFYSIDDLTNVKGISSKTVETNRAIIAI